VHGAAVAAGLTVKEPALLSSIHAQTQIDGAGALDFKRAALSNQKDRPKAVFL
jgi:hypothetical protein